MELSRREKRFISNKTCRKTRVNSGHQVAFISWCGKRTLFQLVIYYSKLVYPYQVSVNWGEIKGITIGSVNLFSLSLDKVLLIIYTIQTRYLSYLTHLGFSRTWRMGLDATVPSVILYLIWSITDKGKNTRTGKKPKRTSVSHMSHDRVLHPSLRTTKPWKPAHRIMAGLESSEYISKSENQ